MVTETPVCWTSASRALRRALASVLVTDFTMRAYHSCTIKTSPTGPSREQPLWLGSISLVSRSFEQLYDWVCACGPHGGGGKNPGRRFVHSVGGRWVRGRCLVGSPSAVADQCSVPISARKCGETIYTPPL